jgi:hypothetical protein
MAENGPVTNKETWERETVQPDLQTSPERQTEFTTISGTPLQRLYNREDLSAESADFEALSRPLSIYSGCDSGDVPSQVVGHGHVLGLWLSRGGQPTVP